MFLSTYKLTIKNLIRSITFWLVFAVVVIISIQNVLQGNYGYYDMNLNELIMDTDSRFVLDALTFNKHITNSFNNIILYSIPIFSVITTVLILNRDYGDKFFEIEKAANSKPAQYLYARLSALLTVNLVVTIISNLLSLQLYVFTRGGVNGMEIGDYLQQSIIGMLRIDFTRGLITIIFYTCFTYLLGALFKNGILAAIGGLGYALISYAMRLFFGAVAEHEAIKYFLNYLHPYQQKLLNYFYCYDSEWYNASVSNQEVIFCISILVGLGIIYSIISYLRIRKRTV